MSISSLMISFRASLVLATVILCQAVSADEPKAADAPPNHNIHRILSQETPDFPLISVGGEECLKLELYDMETRELKVSLKNITKAPVIIKAIIPGCPCLTLKSQIENVTVEPNALFPVDFTINAKKLKSGPFDRFFYVEIDGQETPARLPVKGEIKELLKFSPNKVIQLGTFIGDVPWTRTFTIESTLAPDKITIKPPQNQQVFNVEVQKESPTVFKVIVSPKGTLKAKKIKEIIQLPVEGVPNYGPAELGISGTVTGWVLALEKDSIILAKNNINHEEPMVVEAKIILKSDKTGKNTRRHKANTEKNDNPSISVLPVADIEEKKARPLSSPETWKPIMNDISIEWMPDNVKLEKIPSDGGIVLKFTLPAGFFKSSRPFLQVPVKHQGNVISMFKILSK